MCAAGVARRRAVMTPTPARQTQSTTIASSSFPAAAPPPRRPTVPEQGMPARRRAPRNGAAAVAATRSATPRASPAAGHGHGPPEPTARPALTAASGPSKRTAPSSVAAHRRACPLAPLPGCKPPTASRASHVVRQVRAHVCPPRRQYSRCGRGQPSLAPPTGASPSNPLRSRACPKENHKSQPTQHIFGGFGRIRKAFSPARHLAVPIPTTTSHTNQPS